MASIFIPAFSGKLEARYHQSHIHSAPMALIMHPHPLHGGTMNTKIVYRLYQTFVEAGFSVLRFNFRGVGHSDGQFDNGIGEVDDAAQALAYLRSNNPSSQQVWLAGFSFGAMITLKLLLKEPSIHRFIALGLPVAMYDFSFMESCPQSGLFIHGRDDEIVPLPPTEELFNRLSAQKDIALDLKIIDNADHFFIHQLDDVKQTVQSYIQDNR